MMQWIQLQCIQLLIGILPLLPVSSQTHSLDFGCQCGSRFTSNQKISNCMHINHPSKIAMNRITNICEASPTPWYVSIKMQGLRCGGTLINKLWVLSAAHCFCTYFNCTRTGSSTTVSNIDLNLVKMNIGAYFSSYIGSSVVPPSEYTFRAAEIIVHGDYEMDESKINHYDFALIRLDYPVMDEKYGLGILKTIDNQTFSPRTIMPICLPPSDFEDTNVIGITVGLGLIRPLNKCQTNQYGPDVFKQCANKWYPADKRQWPKEDWETPTVHYGFSPYRDIFECDSHNPPPSALDPICAEFNKKIKTLKEKKKNNETFTEEEEQLVREYSLSGEFLLLSSDKIMKKLKDINETHCYDTDFSDFGWCATCNSSARPGEPGYCDLDMEGRPALEEEIATPSIHEGWGFCSESCSRLPWSTTLKETVLTVLNETYCEEFGNRVENEQVTVCVNVTTELCAVFLNYLNATLFNYTTESGSDDRKFTSLDWEKLRSASPEEFENILWSKRLKNSEFGNFTLESRAVIGGFDTCQGDSGGPLWTRANYTDSNNITHVNASVLIGVTSRGGDCGSQNYPGIYSRVKKVLKWIRHHASKKQKYKIRYIPNHKQGINGVALDDKSGEEYTISPFCKKKKRKKPCQKKKCKKSKGSTNKIRKKALKTARRLLVKLFIRSRRYRRRLFVATALKSLAPKLMKHLDLNDVVR